VGYNSSERSERKRGVKPLLEMSWGNPLRFRALPNGGEAVVEAGARNRLRMRAGGLRFLVTQ
jgi:hypothetical protein